VAEIVSHEQNAGQNDNIKIDNKSFERVKQFKYLGTTLTNRNFIEEESKSRLKSGNACYHSVQDLLSSGFSSSDAEAPSGPRPPHYRGFTITF
jgi:hypothetical protein